MSSQVFMSGRRPTGSGLRQSAVALAIVAGAALVAGCASRQTPAPVSSLSGEAASPASESTVSGSTVASGAAYTVQPGDTLYSIARAHNMTVEALASSNHITDPTQLAVGQSLRVSSTSVAVVPPVADAGASTGGGTVTLTSEPATEPVVVPGTGSIDKPKVPARAPDANLVSWGWPASGAIIQDFTPASKGIDIEGAIGSPVVAAADGDVLYTGNGLRGLGNLVLLGHGNNFITAYAHNETLLVQTGGRVKKGEKIATLGQSDTTSPRLHFEIRRSGTSVNPLSYLPVR